MASTEHAPGVRALLASEPRARRFLMGHAQSALGTGAGHVALVLLAVEVSRSAWGVSLVLLADFLPAMLVAPLLGALIDRTSARRQAILADLLRAAAFCAMPFSHGLVELVALALAAGAGSALFQPASLAALPQLVAPARLSALTAVHSALTYAGMALGPALAALALLAVDPKALLAADGVTFLLSALCLASITFGAAHEGAAPAERSLLAAARAGLGHAFRDPALRTVILSSAGVIMFAGTWNVGEVFLARDTLDAGDTGFALIIAFSGAGIVTGSLVAARSRTGVDVRRRFLLGIALVGLAAVASGLAPVLIVALVAFFAGGVGSAFVMVHQRLIVQRTTQPDRLARVFAAVDGLTSWGFAIAFVGAGAALQLTGPRTLFVAAGVGTLLLWAWAVRALPRVTDVAEEPARRDAVAA